MAKKHKPIGVIDVETDPFKFQREPKPFAAEFYSRETGETFTHWGDDCIDKLMLDLEALSDDYLIYAHNGGKFDFHFMIGYLRASTVKMIGARIVQAGLFHHTIRDSFSLIPVPLRAGGAKLDIDYDKMERECRDRHKAEILEYLHRDCVALLDLVEPTVERFGRELTVGAIAIKQIAELHPFTRSNADHDSRFRPYYYGGRVECFHGGIRRGPFAVYDVNSMYPHVMRNRRHPANGYFTVSARLPDSFELPYFAIIRANNRGALPAIVDGSLDFNVPEGLFHVCSHELEVAMRYGLVDVLEVIECHQSVAPISFVEFVDKFYAEKVDCKQRGDKIGELHAKFMLNSGYGKFGQNPANFTDNRISFDMMECLMLMNEGWQILSSYGDNEWFILGKDTDPASHKFYDVAIAASITSAARAVLLEAMQNATGVLYCDTDSIICESFGGDVSDTTLGAWKLEKVAPSVAIAGKKLYALYDHDDRDMVQGRKPPIKLASKGGTLTLPQMLDMCKGKKVRTENMAPTYSLFRPTTFIHREMRSTLAIAGDDAIVEHVIEMTV